MAAFRPPSARQPRDRSAPVPLRGGQHTATPFRRRNFRRHRDGRYSFSERAADGTESTVILNADFERVGTATLAGDLDPRRTGGWDFLILENGNYLLMMPNKYPALLD